MSDEELAKEARIPVLVLQGIRKIESGANSSAVRFEPHVFLRITGKGKRANSPFKNDIPFTRDPVRKISLVKKETDRAAFEHASKFDKDAAIRSTSWGLYQVMGGHLIKLFGGEGCVEEFDNNSAHVSDRLLVSWFRGNRKAALAARQFNIAELARRYNGSERWGIRVAAAIKTLRGE